MLRQGLRGLAAGLNLNLRVLTVESPRVPQREDQANETGRNKAPSLLLTRRKGVKESFEDQRGKIMACLGGRQATCSGRRRLERTRRGRGTMLEADFTRVTLHHALIQELVRGGLAA